MKFNKGPEGMALIDGGRTIVTVNEAHLLHDAEATRQDQASDGTLTRVTYYDVASGEAVKEYVLPVGPLYPGAKDRGMSSLLSDEEDNLYVLERGYIPGEGNRAEIYAISGEAATDVLGEDRISGAEKPMRKEKIFDFSDLGESCENVEGMAWGDADKQGEKNLYVISDNNFSDKQKTLIHHLVVSH